MPSLEPKEGYSLVALLYPDHLLSCLLLGWRKAPRGAGLMWKNGIIKRSIGPPGLTDSPHDLYGGVSHSNPSRGKGLQFLQVCGPYGQATDEVAPCFEFFMHALC